MLRNLMLAWVALATLVYATEPVETYRLRGRDAAGQAVEGVLRIDPNSGSLERQVQVGGARRSDTFRATRSAAGGGVVWTSQAATRSSLTEGLTGASGGADRSLRVVRSPAGEVSVVFSDGSYSSTESGVRLYDLQQLRDEVPAHGLVGLELKLSRSRGDLNEAVLYRRRGDSTREVRTYEQVSVNGHQLVEFGTQQSLKRTAEGWELTEGSEVEGSHLMRGSLRPGRVTALLPQEPVAVNATWEIPLGDVAKLFRLSLTGPGRARGRLIEVQAVQGGLRHSIQIEIDAKLNAKSFTKPAALSMRLAIRQGPKRHEVRSTLSIEGRTKAGAFKQSQSSRNWNENLDLE